MLTSLPSCSRLHTNHILSPRTCTFVGLLLAAAGLLAPSSATASPPQEQGWAEVSNESGIMVWQRQVEGSDLVQFRGEATVNAHIRDALAVLYDHRHRARWMARTSYHALVEPIDDTHAVLYSQLVSNFPFVSHRDVVFEVEVHFRSNPPEIFIPFRTVTHKKMPPRQNHVRMPRLDGIWKLVPLGPKRTAVTYEVIGDPGGYIPKWVANIVSRRMPHVTLERMRMYIGQDLFRDTSAKLKLLFDWSDVEHWRTKEPEPSQPQNLEVAKPGATSGSAPGADPIRE